MFLAADYRRVGYTLPWVRTPVEVYGGVPLSSSDGLDATWRWSAGSLRNATQVFYGRTNTHLYEGNRLRARGIAGLSHSIERGPLSARLSALTADLTMQIGSELFAALRAFGPPGVALSDRYAIDSKRVGVVSAGFNYDPGEWFVNAEIGRSHSRSLLGKSTAIYAGGGYRFGDLTPYVGFARVRANSATSDPGLPLAALPARLRPTAALLNAGLNAYLSTIPVQTTASAGLRWDVAANVALKAQYDRVRPTDGSRGTLINQQAGFRSGQTVHVASAALDFVF
jgi:predicted porin